MSKDKPIVNTKRLMVAVQEMIDWPRGSPDEIIREMEELRFKYEILKWTNINICEEWHGYEDCFYYINGERLEDDSEYWERVGKEEDVLADWEEEESKRKCKEAFKLQEQKERELKELARLKAKYEAD